MWNLILCSVILAIVATGCKNDRFPTSGVWSDDPPYWIPEGCKILDFNKQSVAQCLGNRTVYAVGSSVARQFPFLIAHILGSSLLNRTEQLTRCEHHSVNWDGCVDEIADVKFRYMYLQYIDGFDYSTRKGFKFTVAHNASHGSTTKLSKSSHSSRALDEADIPVISMEDLMKLDSILNGPMGPTNVISFVPPLGGMARNDPNELHKNLYLSSFEVKPENEVHCPSKISVCSPQQIQKWPTPIDGCWHLNAHDCLKPLFKDAKPSDILIISVGISYGTNMFDGSDVDYDAWITASAISFQRAVNLLFPGRVFRVTLSPVQDKMKPHTQFSGFLRRTEELLTKVFLEGTIHRGERPWFTVDQWSINEHHLDLYNDYVHFQGALTKASLNNILSEYCTFV